MAVRDWPGWLQFTASAAFGAAAAVVGAALSFADVRRDAKEAVEAVPRLETRIRTLEDGVFWIKTALRTGRDPDTGAPFPWAGK
jgi:hypothetical protein